MTTDYQQYAEYPHIGIDSIEQNTGRITSYRTVAQDNVKSGKYKFTSENVIYSKIRPKLNKVALPTFDGLCSADAYPMRAKPEVCRREFLAFVLRSHFFLDYIVPLSIRSRMPKANKEQIAGFTCPIPPLDVQDTFIDFAASVDKSKFKSNNVDATTSRFAGQPTRIVE